MDKEHIPDCLFPSDNELEIPSLLPDVQPEFCDIPFVCWGETARTFQMNGNGTLHFYTDDYRFNAVFEHPEKILQMNPANIVEPNFSLYSETPVAFGLQQIYKKRLVARSMQERGIGVFVDLNVNSKYYKLNMLGVPAGWRAYCTRVYGNRMAYLEFEHALAKSWAGDNAPRMLFVIYGGGNPAKEFARRNGCVYVEQLVNVRNKMKSLDRHIARIQETIAFPDEDINAIVARKSEIRQLYDFTGGQNDADPTNPTQ